MHQPRTTLDGCWEELQFLQPAFEIGNEGKRRVCILKQINQAQGEVQGPSPSVASALPTLEEDDDRSRASAQAAVRGARGACNGHMSAPFLTCSASTPKGVRPG